MAAANGVRSVWVGLNGLMATPVVSAIVRERVNVLAIEEVFNNRVTNVVFMGMGEPMLNLKEVLAAHRCLNKCLWHSEPNSKKVVGRSSVHSSVVAADGTIKLLIKLEDNRLVETVGIPVSDDKGSVRLTACVSSQVGCPLRCTFCATGKGGFSRNLKGHEIVE